MGRNFKNLLWAICAIAAIGGCLDDAKAQEIEFFCSMKEIGTKPSDPIAKEWLESEFLQRIVFSVDPAKEIVTRSPDELLWKSPSVTAKRDELRIEWRFWTKPLEREARVLLGIDRYTGDATLMFLMRAAENNGPVHSFGSLRGRCNANARKF